MTEKEILLAFVGKTLNLTPEQVAPLLYKLGDDQKPTELLADSALTELLRMDAERVSKLKPNTQEIFDNGYKKAQLEIAGKWEKSLREKLNVDPENKLQGDALVDSIKAAGGGKGMDPDKVKSSPEYIELERQMKKAISEKEAEFGVKIKEIETGFQREQSWQKASTHIKSILKGMNVVLPEDPAKAERMLDMFLYDFKDLEFQPDGDGFIPMKDGKRIEDAHGYAKPLADIVKSKAESLFEIRKQPPAGNAGNQGGQGGGQSVNVKFKDENDFIKQYNEATTPESRAVLATAWEAHEKGQG